MDERGVPLSIVVCGANPHDVTQVETLLENIVIEIPKNIEKVNLCADAGYTGEKANKIMTGKGYIPHVRPRGEEISEKERNPDYKPRRWVVEASHSWFTRFRKLYIRYEKKNCTYLALHHLAAAIISLRKINIIYE